MKKYIYLFGVLGGIFFTAFAFFQVQANPSQFQTTFNSSTGSTLSSPVYTTAGKATSTITVYSPSTVSNKYDKAIVSYQITSTTTPPTVYFRVETSFDGTNWYSYSNATTTTGLLGSSVFSHVYATTSHQLYNDPGANATKNTSSFTIDLPAPYTRIVSYSQIGNPAYDFHMSARTIREQ